jgi:hypothetical protein
MGRRKEVPLSKMKEGHVNVGDIVRLGWPGGLGDGLFLVTEKYPVSYINDLQVVSVKEGVTGQKWYTRSLGATVVAR